MAWFDELSHMKGLRSKTFSITNRPGAHLAAIDLMARSGNDWFFARKWVSTKDGEGRLFDHIDHVEAREFRNLVSERQARAILAPKPPWVGTARQMYNELNHAEKAIFRELFPQEWTLIGGGYDWDADGVTTPTGQRLAQDSAGRILEPLPAATYEWVRIDDERTWRRVPVWRAGGEVT